MKWLKDMFLETLGVGVPRQDGRPIQLQTKEVKRLWAATKEISHPKFAFLDKGYSPSSRMPAMDFTPWIANRIAAKDWKAIRELLAILDDEVTAQKMEAITNRFQAPDFLEAPALLFDELKATLILSSRIKWMGADVNRKHLRDLLRKHVFACHPFTVLPVDKPGLRQGFAYSPGFLATSLARYPVTFRICVEESLKHGRRKNGTLRVSDSGGYILSQYGESRDENRKHFAACKLFVDDLTELSEEFSQHAASWLEDLERVGKVARRL